MVKRSAAPEAALANAGAIQLRAAVQDADLASFADDEVAARLAVLEADKELVHRLMLRSYAGREWQAFARALAEYGLQVVGAWVKSGKIFAECAKKGFGGLDALSRTHEDIHDLTSETVAMALVAFRDRVLVPGVWDPTRGASLKTFFIGQCVLQFPNVYRAWRVAKLAAVPAAAGAVGLDDVPSPGPSPAVLVDLARAWLRITRGSPEWMEVMRKLDYTQPEIAGLLNTTTKAIALKLYRHRAARKR